MNARLAVASTDHLPLPGTQPFAIWTTVRGCDGGTRCGDYTAYRLRSDGQLAVVVVDIAGRGEEFRLPAYFLATNLLGLLTLGCSVERAATLADRDFRTEFPSETPEFASVFAALIDPYKARVKYVAGGNETALVLRDRDRALSLEPTGPAFGLLPGAQHAAESAEFQVGDTLIVVTDGITGARDAADVSFGVHGLRTSLLRALQTGEDPSRAVVGDATAYGMRAADDRAALAVSFNGIPLST